CGKRCFEQRQRSRADCCSFIVAATSIPISTHKCLASSKAPVKPCTTNAVKNAVASAKVMGFLCFEKPIFSKYAHKATKASRPITPVCAATLRKVLCASVKRLYPPSVLANLTEADGVPGPLPTGKLLANVFNASVQTRSRGEG